jgi:hypothetical protein
MVTYKISNFVVVAAAVVVVVVVVVVKFPILRDEI